MDAGKMATWAAIVGVPLAVVAIIVSVLAIPEAHDWFFQRVLHHAETPQKPITVAPPDPNIAIRNAMAEMDIGVQKEFVVGKLGQPRHSEKFQSVECDDYAFAFAKMQLWFDNSGRVLVIYVVATNPEYQPEVITQYLDPSYLQDRNLKGCLGCFSFRDVTVDANMAAPTPDNPHLRPTTEDEGDPQVVYFNMGASATPSLYVEQFSVAGSWARQVFLVKTSEGINGEFEDKDTRFLEFMRSWESSKEKEFSDFFQKLPSAQQAEFNQMRGRIRPNAYLLIGDDANTNAADNTPLPLGGDKIGSVSCSGTP